MSSEEMVRVPDGTEPDAANGAEAPVAADAGSTSTVSNLDPTQSEPEPQAEVPQAAAAEATAETVPPETEDAPVAPPSEGEPSVAPDEPAAERPAKSADDFDAAYSQSMSSLHDGQVITGTVVHVDREGVMVDVGAKSEGIIRPHELSRSSAANMRPESQVKVGDQIRVVVIHAENEDGHPVLSKKRADFEQAWEQIQKLRDNNETIEALVTERVKGGLTVDVGIRGFVPASHVDNGNLKTNLDRYVGQTLKLKVIEVDRERRKVVLSNKLALVEDREARSAQTRADLTEGQTRVGTVRRLTTYGAFVDLGGIDGLLHISEMAWTRVNDPHDVLREGQQVEVLILKVDIQQNRVSLSMRQILPDPFVTLAERVHAGDLMEGTVTRIAPFGAFVQVDGGVEGIVPNAELPRNHTKATPAVNPGDKIQVRVVQVRPDERRLTLSVRGAMPDEPESEAQTVAPRETHSKRARPDRDGEPRDEPRHAPGAHEQPRYTIGDAFEHNRKERTRKEKRGRQVDDEADEDLTDIGDDLDVMTEADTDAEGGAEPTEEA